ncbi:putative Ig domain-containing protein [Nitrosomonas sp. Nm84]|uniref:beta strand repeat-containing protein n=1 Tax=Nitrosomonas sp. Nm84 TaxID=200124 RepID=UPI000D75C5E1|nr:cadherin-like domain-containing protein [Nitrosomonas sp. Nm84]PXW90755.1 putative Ig domain-containing protein [Nitrosomonas sp. Nm84]
MSIAIDLNSVGIGYTENQNNLILFDSATIFSDGNSLVDTVKITLNNAFAAELLAVSSLPTGYTSSYDADTGVLTISNGIGDISDLIWGSVLRSIYYSNTSDNPLGTRLITVVASDTSDPELSDSLAVDYTIDVTAVNDAPVIAGDLAATVAEGGNYLLTTDDLGEADPDDDGVGLTYTVTSLAHGTVNLDGSAITSFTAKDVIDGKVSFAHDGSETASAGFSFSLEDGGEDGVLPVSDTFSFTVTPVNDNPTGTVTIDGTAQENAILTADTSTIDDNDGLGTFSYQWLRDNTAIDGAIGATYTLGNDDVGKKISVEVSYTDGHGTPESLTSTQTGFVTNVNDNPTGAVMIDGTAQENAILTADTSTIDDNDGLGTFSYQWLRDNTAIDGAIGATYTLGNDDVGKKISVEVSYTDGHGTPESLTSTQTGFVTNVNDNPTGAVTIDGTAQENAILTADTSTIGDNDGLGTFSYQWLRDNTAIDGAIGATYTLGNIDVGKKISVEVSYTDGHGSAESLTSAQTALVSGTNQAPVLLASLVDQAIQYDTADWSYDAGASFSDSDSLSYSAKLNGNDLPGWIQINPITGAITGAPDFGERGTYTLEVTATDTHGLFADDTLTVAVTAFDAGRLLVSTSANNVLAGTSSNDTVTYAYAAAPVAVSLATTAAQNTGGAGSDTLTNIDNLIGSNFNDNLTGNAQNNVLDGGSGTDTLVGGAGDDSYVVDLAGDIVTEKLSAGIDTVISSVTYTIKANVENLTLIGVLNINGTGNALANTLIGNSASNTLNGSTGADTLMGRLGNDNYTVDNVNDIVTENVDEGTDKVNSSATYTLSDNVENLSLTGTAAINGTGNNLANILLGNSAANRLDGGAGADALKGGAGDDTYIVDNAGDIVGEILNAGSDTVNSSVTYTLPNNVESLVLSGASAINGTGNTLANTITGNAGANILNGGIGADTLIGGGGDDGYIVDNVGDIVIESLNQGIDRVNSAVTYILPDNIENLTLTGTAAIDAIGNGAANTLTGNGAPNQLTGGVGNDILNGAAGDNTLTGGSGRDYFQFKTADHLTAGRIDTVTDYSVVDDTIKLENDIFTVFASIVMPDRIPVDQFVIGTQALDANDYIIYNSGTGALLYDADGVGGNDAVQFATLSTGLAMTNWDVHVI